jgi:hypothetical protein
MPGGEGAGGSLPGSDEHFRGLRISVVCGPKTSGKTEFLTHILNNGQGLRWEGAGFGSALLPVAMALLPAQYETGFASLQLPAMPHNSICLLVPRCAVIENGTAGAEEGFAERSRSCICCTQRDDLPAEAWRLAETGAYDCLLFECCGWAEPGEVVGALTRGPCGARLSSLAHVDTAVTVVDSAALLGNL